MRRSNNRRQGSEYRLNWRGSAHGWHCLDSPFLALCSHELSNLRAGERTVQIAHCPAGIEQRRRLPIVNVIQNECARADIGQQLIDLLQIDWRLGGSDCLQPTEHTRFIVVGLQLANEPCPGVGQPFIVEINRILRRQRQADSEGACLFQQAKQRLFGWWIARRRWEKAKQFIKIDQRSQRACPAQGAHP